MQFHMILGRCSFDWAVITNNNVSSRSVDNSNVLLLLLLFTGHVRRAQFSLEIITKLNLPWALSSWRQIQIIQVFFFFYFLFELIDLTEYNRFKIECKSIRSLLIQFLSSIREK